MKTVRIVATTVLMAAMFFLVGCGGSGGGDDGGQARTDPAHPLAGTWGGVYEDVLHGTNGRGGTVQVVIDENGHITATAYEFNGAKRDVLQGDLVKRRENVYTSRLTNGSGNTSRVLFYVDPAAQHAAFMTSRFTTGALQRGKDVSNGRQDLPNDWNLSSLEGHWEGQEFAGVSFKPANQFSISAAITSSGNIDGSDGAGCTFNGDAGSFQDGYTTGGTYHVNPGVSNCTTGGKLAIYLTPDESFVAVWACDTEATNKTLEQVFDEGGCNFIAMSKQ